MGVKVHAKNPDGYKIQNRVINRETIAPPEIYFVNSQSSVQYYLLHSIFAIKKSDISGYIYG